MSVTPIHGRDLADLMNNQLGGYQGALDDAMVFSFLNEGKNEVWGILKTLGQNYFGTSSQSTDTTQDSYFGPLDVTKREYNLPNDCREVRFLEVTDVGYEDTRFEYRPLSSTDFIDARRANTNNILNADTTIAQDVYYYTIVGKKTLMFAQFPQIAFHVTIWYNRILPDFDADAIVDEILYPFVQKITEYAVKKATLTLQDLPLSEAWRETWRESVQRIASTADPRDSSGPLFVDDYMGYSIES